MLRYINLPESYKAPKYPIVLCHGFSGFDHLFMLPVFGQPPPLTDKFKQLFNGNKDSTVKEKFNTNRLSTATAESMGVDNKSLVNNGKYLIEYWNGIKQHLEDAGCTVLVAKVPPFASIENRASVLHHFIKRSVPQLRKHHHVPKDEPVKINLIAHSMGGLDCRYLIHQLYHNKDPNPEYKIVSLTTISTPHRGTTAADFALDYSPVTLIRDYFPSIYQLSTPYAKKFNNQIKDDPSVKYFSYGAEFHPTPASMFLITWKIVFDKEGPNDGLVSLRSAKWGQFKGYLDDVDHADLINWMGLLKKAKMAIGAPAFNPKYFYLDVIDNLANNGL
jgi:triacylglycerol lipase